MDGPTRRKKRSPASPASENGANRVNKCSKRKSTAARPNAQEPERHFYWIADGQTNVGFVEQIGASYKALAADERALGTFGSLKAAADAVSAACEAALSAVLEHLTASQAALTDVPSFDERSPDNSAEPGQLPSPAEIVRPWGARYSARAFLRIKINKQSAANGLPFGLTADSLHRGMGYTTRKNAEDCLLFKVGAPKRLAADVDEVILAPVREHSRKPDEAVERIERFCAGPRVELFAREAWPGWDSWGDEVGKFAAEGVS
jgi:hypothetical protein